MTIVRRNGFGATLAALPLVLGPMSTTALADHAADVAKCNAIQDAAKRHACLALISPAGQASPAPNGQSTAPTTSPTCASLIDIHEMAECLAKPPADKLPAARSSAEQAIADAEYLMSLFKCAPMPAGSTSRAQCLTTLGWPKDTSWVSLDTYDTAYRSAIKTCVAHSYFTDAKACELEAFLEAILRRVQRVHGL